MKAFILVVAALAACTKPNPEACCDTADQCTMFGISGPPRPCGDGLVCDSTGTCIASECDTSADCTSPDTPICIDHFCVQKCTVDADCAGIAGKPVCETDGTCGECKDDTQCTDASKSVCDTSAHSCRGCAADVECPGGVCVEADGTCVANSEVLFLTAGGNDTGTCAMAAPCLTFEYTLGQVTPQRNVIKVLDDQFIVSSNGVRLLGVSVVIDGPTLLTRTTAGPVVNVANGSTATLEGITFATNNATSVTVTSGSEAVVFGSKRFATLDANGGRLVVVTADGMTGDVTCENGGQLLVDRSHFTTGAVSSNGCDVTVHRSRFESANNGHVINLTNGQIAVENNVITATSALDDAVAVSSGKPGSYFRFNTMANRSGVVDSATALSCDSTINVDSNILAWGTTNTPTCLTTYTLFDANVSQTGMGNRSLDSSTFFVDFGTGDFHPSSTSPALMGGDPGSTPADDLDGNPRPNPAGTAPDTGCYEAP